MANATQEVDKKPAEKTITIFFLIFSQHGSRLYSLAKLTNQIQFKCLIGLLGSESVMAAVYNRRSQKLKKGGTFFFIELPYRY